MGIVAAQCWVFITQNDICAPRPLYYHLFFLDNRCVPARSPPRRLLDSLPSHSIPQPFHVLSRPVSPLGPLPEPSGGPSRHRFRHSRAFRRRLSGVLCAVPAASPLVFSSVFRLLLSSAQSESGREGRSRSIPVCGVVPSSCLAVCIRMRGGEAFSVSYRLAWGNIGWRTRASRSSSRLRRVGERDGFGACIWLFVGVMPFGGYREE